MNMGSQNHADDVFIQGTIIIHSALAKYADVQGGFRLRFLPNNLQRRNEMFLRA